MQLQQCLIQVWITISRSLSQSSLSRTAQRYALYVALVVLALCGLYLLCISDPARLGVSALHLLNQVPFGDPYP